MTVTRDFAAAQVRFGSLSADLGTPETAAAPQIADVCDSPVEPDDAGSGDGCLWDVASMCWINAK
jgi:hypothetical protein